MATNPILAQAQKASTNSATPAQIVGALEVADNEDEQLLDNSKVSAVREAMALATKRSVENIQKSEAAMAQTDTLTQVMTDTLAEAAQAQQTIALAKDTANLEAQNKTIDVFEASGGQDAQVLLTKTLAEEQGRLADLLDKKTDIMNDEHTGVGLIDNIINGFRSTQLDANIQAVAGEVQNTSNQIANTTAATESFARVNAVTKKTLNSATIEANQKLISSQATLKATEQELMNLNSNARARSELANADQRMVQNLLAMDRLEGEEEARELQREKNKFQRESMIQQRDQWEAGKEAREVALETAKLNLEKSKKLSPTQIAAAEWQFEQAQKNANEAQEQEDNLIFTVQRAQAALGTTVEDPSTIKRGLTADKGKYNRLLEIGSAPDANITFGSTPAEARDTIATISPSGNVKETKVTTMLRDIADYTETKLTTVDPTTGALPKRPRNKDEAASLFNSMAQSYVLEKAANIVTGDQSNPFHAPPFTVIEQSTNYLSASPLYTKVLKEKKMKETNPQTIVDAAIAGVLAKTISIDDAIFGIEGIFDQAALINNREDGGFKRAGLPNQVSYRTTLQRPKTSFESLKSLAGTQFNFTPFPAIGRLSDAFGQSIAGEPIDVGFSNTTTLQVDLMDPVSIRSYLTTVLSATPKQKDNN